MPRKKNRTAIQTVENNLSVKISKMLKHAENVRKARKMHAFCCNDTLPVKTATYILYTVCLLLLSLILDILESVWGAFRVRSGCVRGAFGERSGCVRIIV